jgi:catechol 2,3-dioxygenase
VSDLARSIAYYEKVIGLHVIRETESRADLGAHGTSDVIVELNEKRGVAPVPRRGRLGLYHFAILLPDRASLGRFVRHLADIGEYAGMSDHFVSEAIYLTDPDGLGIEVYADRPRSSWRIADTNLSMGSIHLDADDLVRAGGAEQWKGAPAGTRIGHVHLYVNDLNVGEKFYHNAVGLDKVRLEFPGALFMSAGGYHHHLGTNTWAAQSAQATDDDARLLEWTIELPNASDLASLGDSLSKNGFAAEMRPGSLVTVDPWTTKIRFRTTAENSRG